MIQPQFPPELKHVMKNPRVVPIFWGHFYVTNPNVVTRVVNLITDLVNGPYMNGLAQYGVHRGTVLAEQIIDIIPPTTGPSTINQGDDPIGSRLVDWLAASPPKVSPLPNVNEQNLLYVIFLPTESHITPSGVAGWHSNRIVNGGPTGSDYDDLFYAVLGTSKASTMPDFASSITRVLGHELAEAFTDRDGLGFMKETSCTFMAQPETDICEIGDNCEQLPCFTYNVGTRTWQVQRYWSNWDNNCIKGDQQVSVRKFLNAIGVDGSGGLRQLHSDVINVDLVASKM